MTTHFEWGSIVEDYTFSIPPGHNHAAQLIWLKSHDQISYSQVHLAGRENEARAEDVFNRFFHLLESVAQRQKQFHFEDYVHVIGLNK